LVKIVFEVLSGKALLSFAVKPLYCALFQVGCVWAEIPSCGCAWERIHPSWYPISGTFSALCVQEPWTLIYFAKFTDLLSSLLPIFLGFFFVVVVFVFVFKYFCSFPFMLCYPSRPHCMQKLVGAVLSPSCHLPPVGVGFGNDLVRESLLQGFFFGPKARPVELNHFFSFR
jgi:hypothetical protein